MSKVFSFIGKGLLLLMLTACAAIFLGGYYVVGIGYGNSWYLFWALAGLFFGVTSALAWYGVLTGSEGWAGVRQVDWTRRLRVAGGIFVLLIVAPLWVHFSASPEITLTGKTAHVERTVPPLNMELDPVLQLSGTGTLEHTADKLGEAVYEAVSSQEPVPQRVTVRLMASCPDISLPVDSIPANYVVQDTSLGRGGNDLDVYYAASDTIRKLSEVRAHANAAAYVNSTHWATISRPKLVPDVPCKAEGHPRGILGGVFGWVTAVLGGGLLWVYWRHRRRVQDGANDA